MSSCAYSTISPKIVRIYVPGWTLFASEAHLLVTRLCRQMALVLGLPSLVETGRVSIAKDSGCFSRLDCRTHLVSTSGSLPVAHLMVLQVRRWQGFLLKTSLLRVHMRLFPCI